MGGLLEGELEKGGENGIFVLNKPPRVVSGLVPRLCLCVPCPIFTGHSSVMEKRRSAPSMTSLKSSQHSEITDE